jgi:hypothetical protein
MYCKTIPLHNKTVVSCAFIFVNSIDNTTECIVQIYCNVFTSKSKPATAQPQINLRAMMQNPTLACDRFETELHLVKSTFRSKKLQTTLSQSHLLIIKPQNHVT